MVDLEAEKLLIVAAKKDPTNFDKLYQLYFDKIYNFLLSRCGQKELAEDLASQTFLKALEKIDSFHWRNVSFSSWLFRIAINNLNSYYRKNKKTVLMADENLVKIADEKNQNETTQDQLEKRQNLEQLYELIKNHLSKKEQNLIALKYFQEKSYQEIGEILNINVNSVGVKLHRIINKMKKHLI